MYQSYIQIFSISFTITKKIYKHFGMHIYFSGGLILELQTRRLYRLAVKTLHLGPTSNDNCFGSSSYKLSHGTKRLWSAEMMPSYPETLLLPPTTLTLEMLEFFILFYFTVIKHMLGQWWYEACGILSVTNQYLI